MERCLDTNAAQKHTKGINNCCGKLSEMQKSNSTMKCAVNINHKQKSCGV